MFTAGWAMKFVPLLGKALKQMVVDGNLPYKLEEFLMITNIVIGSSILSPGPVPTRDTSSNGTQSFKPMVSSMHK